MVMIWWRRLPVLLLVSAYLFLCTSNKVASSVFFFKVHYSPPILLKLNQYCKYWLWMQSVYIIYTVIFLMGVVCLPVCLYDLMDGSGDCWRCYLSGTKEMAWSYFNIYNLLLTFIPYFWRQVHIWRVTKSLRNYTLRRSSDNSDLRR